MCIRDRVSTQSTWGNSTRWAFTKRKWTIRKQIIFLILTIYGVILSVLATIILVNTLVTNSIIEEPAQNLLRENMMGNIEKTLYEIESLFTEKLTEKITVLNSLQSYYDAIDTCLLYTSPSPRDS
eukprot:TRINITY_DN6625_c0_g1_i2.p1 TRINITY_DN6625_c0_g1~~TRINITY_DN6625_c0_g1_i2.p1  ORF type:complete len:125 (-),score=32.74 TRINITY_DN6625_c0_g1_i2:37-411(-)